MSKHTQEQWDRARALFEADVSFRDIAKDKRVNIDASNIAKKAKKEGWERGVLPQIITDTVRVSSEFATLTLPQQEVVATAVEKQLEGMAFYSTNARKIVKIGMVAFSKDPTPLGMKNTLEAMKTGMIVEGLVPFHPNAQVINNTNAQQNNLNPAITLTDAELDRIICG